ncbi:DUF397 domain-containing protein [Streptomyces venezuelae]|uniref:DUF397 domain-containing protein n=1 Tax=Streptomyces venezuelae TaxID=54571 RepID=UPI003668720B
MNHVRWQKSSFSGGGDGDTCIELAATGPHLLLRESEDPATELTTAPETFAGLLRALRAGNPPGQQP